jgi:hypothetical protein
MLADIAFDHYYYYHYYYYYYYYHYFYYYYYYHYQRRCYCRSTTCFSATAATPTDRPNSISLWLLCSKLPLPEDIILRARHRFHQDAIASVVIKAATARLLLAEVQEGVRRSNHSWLIARLGRLAITLPRQDR